MQIKRENFTNISERIAYLIDYLNVSTNKFSNTIGASNSYFNKLIKNGGSIGSDRIEKILRAYPEINPEWLITGEGAMLKNDNDKLAVAKRSKNNEGIPLIPISAMAGFGTGDCQILEHEVDRYIVPHFKDLQIDFMINVRGSSMQPKYNSGDVVACKKLPLDTFFQWNKVYVLDTTQGPLVKRVKKSQVENCIQCISDNVSYEPFDLPLNEIRSLAIVLGVIRLE